MFARLCLIFLILIGLAGCDRPPPLVQQESYVFGTRVEILVAGAPEKQAREAAAAVLRDFDRLHRTYHAWQPSELTAVNDALAAGKSIRVSPEMLEFITEARDLARLGSYRFDPGIGRLIQLWGFHSDEFKPQLPDPEALAAWRARPASVAQLRLDGPRVSSSNPALALDFGGYLKGVALDRAAALLRAQGIRNALINIGGNVMALGDKYGKPWKVGIQHPRQPGPLATLELRDGEAIGTSGDYQRYFELQGRRYSHLLDPASGEPADHTQAVTVLMPPGPKAGTLSDALSKPIFIAGPEHWQEAARQVGVTQVLRVGPGGEIQVTQALKGRLSFLGKPPPMTEVP
ncbi:FAD:protein FMN transferase [Azovibrio restrictus]|uniref:FAD:protein FMN transferase n=1 Tax=Azovibrio restrictus TaxID=146938 RepID=UPI0026F1C9D7|nr:FAD:protein FMN transferase [Azovibrio restrictus]MDD3483466.1 FAD:protein FMN transferase [Azovibrio restrictus]